MLQIRPVQGRAEIRRFVDYMYERNASDPHWVPPLRIGEHERLNPKKNPFFDHATVELMLAWRRDRVVGRIAAIDDRLHQETHGDNVAMFGFFEAADAEVARALLSAVEQWAGARGRTHVRGPISPSLNEMCGVLIDGFDTDPMLLMPHNPPEYGAQIEAAGYNKVKDLFAWIHVLQRDLPPAFERTAHRLRDKHGITIRSLDLGEFTREVERLRAIYCTAWERNWGFVPPTNAERWDSASLVSTLLETLDLAKARAVDGELLGRLAQLAPAVYLAADAAGDTVSTDFRGALVGEITAAAGTRI
jgi:hypothetical protein